MSGNRLTGMAASEDVFRSILEFIEHSGCSQQVELDVFEWMHLSNNIFEDGGNLWLARDLRLTGNDFGDTDSSYAERRLIEHRFTLETVRRKISIYLMFH